jgi:hypothetical protein
MALTRLEGFRRYIVALSVACSVSWEFKAPMMTLSAALDTEKQVPNVPFEEALGGSWCGRLR